MKVLAGVGILALVGAVACTTPNPLSCADGACTDPSLPFCDVDGAISGTPATCIAGDCSANEVQGCRGDTAVVCNADGTNYDLKDCTGMCDAHLGCIECTSDEQCSAGEPVCDPTSHGCRGCEADAECPSNVCAKTTGTCVDPATLIYAAPAGSVAAGCGTQQTPCDLPTAIAKADTVRNIVKLGPGDYSIATVDLTKAVTVLGSGSTLRSGLNPLFLVREGARLSLQDATVTAPINCTSATAALPELRLDSVHFTGGKGITARPCTVVATRTTFSAVPPQSGTAVFISLPTTGASDVTLDRCTIDGMGIVARGAGNRIHLVNTLVNGTGTAFGAAVTFEMDASGAIEFSTLVNAPMTCSSSASVRVENSIMFGTTADDVLYQTGAVCPVHYSLMNPQVVAYTGWDHVVRGVDPLLVSLPNRDLHVLGTSPTIDAADPSSALATDLEGTPRPQGLRLDMGAYERKQQ